MSPVKEKLFLYWLLTSMFNFFFFGFSFLVFFFFLVFFSGFLFFSFFLFFFTTFHKNLNKLFTTAKMLIGKICLTVKSFFSW